MNHSKYLLLLSCGAVLLGLFMACAKQSSNENENEITVGSGGSIFAGGASSNGSTTGNGSTSSGGGTYDQYGMVQVDADKVTEVLTNPSTCQGSAAEAEAQPASILFLVDVSNSMNYSTDATGGRTKWQVTQEALKNAVAGLPFTFSVGVSFFPNMAANINTTTARPASACVNTADDVAVNLADDAQTAHVQSAIDGLTPNSMAATPTHDAMNIAIDQLVNYTQNDRKYIVLITDGQPTQREGCIGTGAMTKPEPTQPIIDAIAAAAALDPKIKTFVVGSPGSEKNEGTGEDVRYWLSAAATAGETQSNPACNDSGDPSYCHFDLSTAPDFGVALTDALKVITQAVITCDFGVPQPTSGTLNPNQVSMFFSDGSGAYWAVVRDPDNTCNVGWSYTDSSNSSVRVCGETCKKIQESPQATLNILFGCEGSVPIL